MQEKHGQRNAILRPAIAAKHYSLKQYYPSKDLAFFVEHYWVARWNLPLSDTYAAEILSNPSVNLSFTFDDARITGVVTKKFSYTLSGAGVAFGIRFLAGGFYPFLGRSVAMITDSTLPVSDVFDTDSSFWSKQVLTLPSDSHIIAHAEKLLRTKPLQPDEHIATINRIIAKIIDDRSIKQVQALAELFNMSERTLQYLFRKYVGVGLKWIINRYRLQEAAAAINAGEKDWAQIANDLNYTDQSHFIRDFKNVIGETPAGYGKLSA